MRYRMYITSLSVAVWLCAFGNSAAPDYHAEVRPILEAHCFDCHDTAARKGGLALDTPEGISLGGDSGETIITSLEPESSPIIRRVTSEDPALRMPPKGDKLSEEQVATLRAWISSGASAGSEPQSLKPTSDWWAFQPPKQAPIPKVENREWVENPIDAFILEKIEETGLHPSSKTDKHTLLRRLYLDLLGLPPSPEEIVRFVNDDNPNAYDQVVEALLVSPHYGEKQAISWLDAARYADTNGYEKDRHRSIWPYRDWVIRAFNNDLPYDRFIIEQIAGDLLANPSEDQLIATGFLRNSLHNEEGGIDAEEFRYEAMVDRINTVSTVFLGLTMECAQCHTHKYDPITHREYFQFKAFLDNTDDVFMKLKDDEIAKDRERIDARVTFAKRELSKKFPLPENFKDGEDEDTARQRNLDEKYQTWLKENTEKANNWSVIEPVTWQTKFHTSLEKLPDRSLLAKGTWANTETYTVDYRSDSPTITAIRIEVLPHDSLPGGGPGRGVIMSPTEGNFLLSEVGMQAMPWYGEEAPATITLQNPSHSYAEEGRSAEQTLDGKLDTGWGVLGKLAQAHAIVYELAEPIRFAEGARITLVLDQYYVHQHTLGRFRVSVTSDDLPVVAGSLPAELEAQLLLEAPTGEKNPELLQFFLENTDELADEHKKIEELEASKPQFPSTLILAERSEYRETLLRHRGEFLNPREAVGAAVPAVLHPFPEHAPRNRLTFAHWLSSKENPLLARVAVNRIWQEFFGKGLVETPEDFGIQGASPTHPELLDWLAVEFMERGWSVKDLIRMIVTSATYQQSSNFTPELLKLDPQNDLLARMSRFRIKAELVRDVALTASGLLNPEIGGPSVYPPVPANLLSLLYSQGPNVWPESKDEQRYRRGLYIYAKRILPYPSGLVFDQPARDTACVRRVNSNTPLQALTLLNDTAIMECAQALANYADGGNFENNLTSLFLRTLSRPPDNTETEYFREFYEKQLERHTKNDGNEIETANTAEAAPEDSVIHNAIWSAIARVLLNLDATITKG